MTAWWKGVNHVSEGLRWESRREETVYVPKLKWNHELVRVKTNIINELKKKNQLKQSEPMVLDCTEGSNCICTHCPSCVLPWSLVHFFHAVVNTSKNKTCYLVYTHQHWLKEKTCAMFKKNLEIYKYMKNYVDRGGIMKQLNKRSVLFFNCVASLTFFFSKSRAANAATQTKCCSTPEQFCYCPLVLLPQGG